MKILKEYTVKDLKDKTFDELIGTMAIDLKYLTKSELITKICELRSELIETQKIELKKDMEPEIEKQLKLIKIIKSKDYSMTQKRKAYLKVIKFMEDTEMILSPKFLEESRELLKFLELRKDFLEPEDLKDIDFIMKKRTSIYGDLLRPDCMFVRELAHTEFVDLLIDLDAKFGLDEVSKDHIRSATHKGYGDLVRTDDPQSGCFYYYDATAYRKMYLDAKKKYESEKSIQL